MKVFSNIPFLRILIPFACGILLALFTGFPVPGITTLLFVFVFVTLLHFLSSRFHLLNKTILLIADIFLLLLGMYLVEAGTRCRQPGYYGQRLKTDTSTVFLAVINDIPQQKAKSLKCRLKILALQENGNYVPVKGDIFAYFKRSAGDSLLLANKALLIRARLSEVPPPANPNQFNYRDYLRNKQIYHVAFIDTGAYWILKTRISTNPVWEAGLTCKQFVLNRLRKSELSDNAYAICAALLTGFDADIDSGIIEAFSHSGTLHVLSVSGLHTGLIYMVLSFLFDLADRRKKHKLLKFVFITLSLWSFALIAGFSPPVLRAVIMFNFLGFGKIYFRSGQRHQINILAVSAFILLVGNPHLITEAGFLLSYFAMIGLFYFQPIFAAFWQPSHSFAVYCWQSITASFAATLSTLPVTLFFFKQFPLWFFVCNLVVVPATFLLLLLALFIVVNLKPVAIIINLLVRFLLGFITLFSSGNFGYIDHVHFTFQDALTLALLITLFAAAIHFRSFRALRISFLLLITWQFFALIESYRLKEKKLFAVYQVGRHSAFSVKNKTKTLLRLDDPSTFAYNIKPHLNSFCRPEISQTDFNYFNASGKSVLILDRPGSWPDSLPGKVQILILANNYVLKSKHILKLPGLEEVIADGSNNKPVVLKTADLCRKFGLRFFSTGESGAYLMAFNETENRR